MDKPAQQAPGANDKVRKAARQLAYDVRYKVKGQFKDGQKTDPASLKRAYMQQLGKSPAPGPVKALAKKMLIGEEYDFVNLDGAASDAILSVFEKIFEAAEGSKYTVRVKDKKTGKSYLRKADRAKIAELRKNPNISSVEIAGKSSGEPDTYDKTGKGKKAAKDYDGDGKVESGSKEHAGAVHNAIQRKKGGKPDGQDTRTEEFIVAEGEEKEKKLDVMTGKNKVVVNPPMNEQQSTMDKPKTGPSPEEKRQLDNKKKMLQKKMMMQRQAMQMQRQGRLPLNYSEENEGSKSKESKETLDPRGNYAMMNMIKNKLRVRGLKMSYDMEGEMVDEKYQGMYQSPASTYNRLKSSDEKARMSPGRRAMAKSDELEKSEPGSKRAKAQKKAAGQMARNFQSARMTKEETEDSLRDRRMERGGVDGNTRYDRPARNVATGPVDKKKAEESRKRAMDAVRASITAKYGKGAIMDTKKK